MNPVPPREFSCLWRLLGPYSIADMSVREARLYSGAILIFMFRVCDVAGGFNVECEGKVSDSVPRSVPASLAALVLRIH